MSESSAIPSCKAFLLCDQTLVESGSGRTSLIGLMNHISIEEFPSEMPRCQAFLQLTDGLGAYNVVVEVHYLNDDEIVYRSEPVQIEINNRLALISYIVPNLQFEIPAEGRYDIIVLINDQELERQTLDVRKSNENI